MPHEAEAVATTVRTRHDRDDRFRNRFRQRQTSRDDAFLKPVLRGAAVFASRGGQTGFLGARTHANKKTHKIISGNGREAENKVSRKYCRFGATPWVLGFVIDTRIRLAISVRPEAAVRRSPWSC